MDNKYKNGKIYKITDIGYNKFYYGSTCESLSRRISHHRYVYANFKTVNKRRTTAFALFDEYGIDNCKIELVEDFPCDNKEQLRQREGWYIQNNPCVNKRVAGRSIQESYKIYYEQNKEKELERKKKYRTHNKEKETERRKKYYEANKEKVLERAKKYGEQNKEKISGYNKKHHEQNREKILERQKAYREQHKDERKVKLKELIHCVICNCSFQKNSKSRHEKTINHINNKTQHQEQRQEYD